MKGQKHESLFFCQTHLSAFQKCRIKWREKGEKIREFSLFPDFGFSAIFPLEPVAAQSIPTETDRWISRISREILRGWYMGGEGSANPNLNLNLSIE
jgi:hypothetical protein